MNNYIGMCVKWILWFCILTEFVLVSIQINDSGIPPVVGKEYSLTCDVSINVSSYQWRKDGEIFPGKTEQVLEFHSLQLSDASNYTCEVVVQSKNYTADNKSVILESKVVITITSLILFNSHYIVPAPLSIMVAGNDTDPVRPIRTTVILDCIVELSPTVNVPVIVNTTWRGPADFMKSLTALSDTDNTTYSSMVTILSFENIHSGVYTCSAEVKAMELSLSQYLNNSRVTSNETRITTGKDNKKY